MRRSSWIAAALAALLLLAAPAAAAPLDAGPTWTWEVDEMRQTGEIVRVAGDTQEGGVLKETVGLGPSAFDFEPVLLPGRAVGSVFSTASGRRYHARAE